MSEKLCVFCKHLGFEAAIDSQGADSFGGESANILCDKGHWIIGVGMYDVEEFRLKILTAQKCPQYNEVKP